MGQKVDVARMIPVRISVGGVWVLATDAVDIEPSVAHGSSGSWWRGTCAALGGSLFCTQRRGLEMGGHTANGEGRIHCAWPVHMNRGERYPVEGIGCAGSLESDSAGQMWYTSPSAGISAGIQYKHGVQGA